MTTKKLDKILDGCLWILFAVLVIGTFLFTRSFKAPKFEIVETSIQIPYEYSSIDGKRYDSFYIPVWKHEDFKRPKVAVYDPRNGHNADIKPEYIEEYKAQMPRSSYPFYTRWTFAIFGLLTIMVTLFSYWIGGFFRDMILYLRLKRDPSFTECAYFLYKDRVGFRGGVKKLIGKGISMYINTKSQELYKKYREDFASLLVHILTSVKVNNDTEVTYYLTYKNLTTDQISYLSHLRSYWDKQIGKDSNAENNVKYLNSIINKKYSDIRLLLDEKDIVNEVNNQLNKMFSNILGSEVLKFYGVKNDYAKAAKLSNRIFIDINVRNHHNSFCWSGQAISSDTNIPGLEIEFKVSHYLKGIEKILWKKYLVPVCTYKAKDEEFAISELYKTMVLDTIRTFDNSAKV